ncbi:MAG: ribonuclease P protein component [Planctomycetes bacterium]|nr:ribonuclease P protein component [Planctomycetota bacterium]
MTTPDRRFGRDRRVRSRRDFQEIYGGRRSIRNRDLTFCWRPAEGDRSRLGLSVGRRIGGAVERNRVKRVLREVFRHEAGTLARPLDLIVIPRAYHSAADHARMLSSFRHLARKLERELAGEERE